MGQVIFINIGGIINSTTISNNQIISASDHGPGMCLVDEWIRKKMNKRFDTDGNIAINWGVYGVPETFIINKNGIIILRHPGPITTNVLKNEIIPILDEINL